MGGGSSQLHTRKGLSGEDSALEGMRGTRGSNTAISQRSKPRGTDRAVGSHEGLLRDVPTVGTEREAWPGRPPQPSLTGKGVVSAFSVIPPTA